jgi:signal transduction histidine kinase
VSSADLASLTGVRSGKNSYYREFRRSSERLEAAVRSLDHISVALVRTVEGPRALLTAVVQAAAEHLQARWVVLAVADGCLPESRPRFLGLDETGRVVDTVEALPEEARPWLARLRGDPPDRAEAEGTGLVVVPMSIDGVPVGGVAGRAASRELTEPLDLSVLRILVNQAAVALHTASLYNSSVALRTRADQLTQEANQHARDLAVRSQELQSAQALLIAAREREALDVERHRIARELHDSVTQYVLSAGMAVEVARGELEGTDVARRLAEARDLTQHAVGQLRAAIYSLNQTGDGDAPVLPRLLEQACALHARPGLAVDLRLEGSPVALPVAAEQSLARLAGEALFNVSAHSGANRCVVRLSYGGSQIRLTVDDDGTGDPATLRTLLRVEEAGDVDGRHRGLVNMASRAAELGGSFAVRRSRLGGVRTLVQVPVVRRAAS